MTYDETLDYLFTKLPMYQRVGAAALKFDLNNITALMDRLGNSHDQVRTIHIAGTNGKGSSAHMLASILQEAGYKTGLHTSPHLKSFTERIRINGEEVSKSDVVAFVDRIKPAIEDIKPSFFEITFAMAIDHFYDHEVDIAIIEVGMGGRLDSTNIITPEVCLITNISLDHQHLLGERIEQIAGEKAGIIKPGIPVVIGKTQKDIAAVFIDKAKEKGSEIIFADQRFKIEQAFGGRMNIICNDQMHHEGLSLDLKGDYQKQNLAGVLAVCDILKHKNWKQIDDRSILNGLARVVKNTRLKGRWQKLGEMPLTIADTGHNEAGIREIVDELAKTSHSKLHIIWGMVQDKDATEMLNLLPKDAIYYFVEPNIPRALSLTKLIEAATTAGITGEQYASVKEALTSARKSAEPDDLIFVGGSTFVVAEIEEL